MKHRILLFRILGNDLGSLHGENQTYDNLSFTLQNELEFKNTKKMYLLNRIYDNKKKKKLIALLEKYNAEYIDIPFPSWGHSAVPDINTNMLVLRQNICGPKQKRCAKHLPLCFNKRI